MEPEPTNRPATDRNRSDGARMAAIAWSVIAFVTWGTMVGAGSDPLSTAPYVVLGWAPWLPLNWLLWRLTRVLPWRTGQRARTGVAHLLLSLVWIVLYSTWIVGLQLVWQGGGLDDLARILDVRLDFWVFFDWAFYFAVAAAVQAHADGEARHLAERRAAEAERSAAEAGRNAAVAEARARARLLQPHFLFNSLNGLAGLMRSSRTEDAVRMVDGLSGILRHTLDAGPSGRVRLASELDAIEAYLDVRRMRFGRRIDFHCEAPAEAAERHVPALLLQPLVENALDHGDPDADALCVRLAAVAHPGWLEVTVENPVGVNGSERGDGHRVGLAAARARLTGWGDGSGRIEVQRDGDLVRARVRVPDAGSGGG